MSVKINENYLLLESNYLFAEIKRRVEKYHVENPDAQIEIVIFIKYVKVKERENITNTENK